MIYMSTGGVKGKKASSVAEEYVLNGIKNVELSAGIYIEDPEKELNELRKSCSFLLHNYFPVPQESFVLNLASLDDEVFSKSFEHVKESIRLSGLFGCKYYSFHAGFLLDPKPRELGKGLAKNIFFDRDKSIERFIMAVNKLSLLANKVGVKLLIENNVFSKTNFERFDENPFLLSDVNGIGEIFDHIDDAAMLLDVAHLKVSSNVLGFECKDFIEVSYNFVQAYHLSDNDGFEDTNKSFNETAWFWKHIRRDLDYYTIEVYDDNVDNLVQQYNLVNEFLEAE